jgi:beta-glucanase (GH16 family)
VNSAGLREFAAPVRIEASIQIPTEQGLVPAFWTLGSSYGLWGSGPITWPDAGEIDILENINAEPNRARYHVHGPDLSGPLDAIPNGDVALGGGYSDVADLDTGFHTYGIDLYPDHIDFRFDGVTRWTVTRAQYEAAGGQWAGVFDQPQYLILNIGSLFSWVGDPTFTGSRQMLVDWVRVSRL